MLAGMVLVRRAGISAAQKLPPAGKFEDGAAQYRPVLKRRGIADGDCECGESE